MAHQTVRAGYEQLADRLQSFRAQHISRGGPDQGRRVFLQSLDEYGPLLLRVTRSEQSDQRSGDYLVRCLGPDRCDGGCDRAWRRYSVQR